MAYVPGCRYDIFISYARENNRDGWVATFRKELGAHLAAFLGRGFDADRSVFLDSGDLTAGDPFPKQLRDNARDSAVLVPILSPGYVTSEWCDKEREEFSTKLPFGAEMIECVVPILAFPVDEQTDLDELLRQANRPDCANFVSEDKLTPWPALSPEWAKKVKQFAGQLKVKLENLRLKCKPVFVGKAPDSAGPLRSLCCKELNDRKLRTTPYAWTGFRDPQRVTAELASAGLAVHFLGGADHAALEAIQHSIRLCAGPTILFEPYGAALRPHEQGWLEMFEQDVQDLRLDPGRYYRLAGKTVQELIALIDEQITSPPSRAAEPSPTAPLSLVCEKSDLESARRLTAEIRAACTVESQIPEFLSAGLTAIERLRRWEEYLNSSGVQLFFHGAAERKHLLRWWQVAEIQRPTARRHWYLAPPDLAAKLESQPDGLSTAEQVGRLLAIPS